MNKEFVDRFMTRKEALRATFAQEHPQSYREIVEAVIAILYDEDYSSYNPTPDPERVHEVDDGDYQGTLVYVIGAAGSQPSTYWYTEVDYGSCSGCDTLLGICDDYSEAPTRQQVDDYMTLALHIVQGLKVM